MSKDMLVATAVVSKTMISMLAWNSYRNGKGFRKAYNSHGQ